jgi:hypothetical protein
MELQAEAERRKRASILESEGQRQAVINVAEGSKQEVRCLGGGVCVWCVQVRSVLCRVCSRQRQQSVVRAPAHPCVFAPACGPCDTHTHTHTSRHTHTRALPVVWRGVALQHNTQVILSSEAEKQAAINRATGEAQAITARAQVCDCAWRARGQRLVACEWQLTARAQVCSCARRRASLTCHARRVCAACNRPRPRACRCSRSS